MHIYNKIGTNARHEYEKPLRAQKEAPIPGKFANLSIAFDLDGTLVDTARDLLRVLNTVTEPDGVPAVNEAELRKLVGYGSRRLIKRAYADGGIAINEDRCDVVQKNFLELYAQDISQLSLPYPGVLETLAILKRGGASLSVCTNKPGYLARPLLHNLKMTRYFERIVGSDDTPFKKPNPGHVFHAAGHRGHKTIIMVGDGAPDILAGKAARAYTILMRYGYSPVPVETLGADVILRSFRSLPSALSKAGLLSEEREI